jgi:hypothetical protein
MVPLNFLSPSYYHFIFIESHTHRIKIKDVFSDAEVCTIPQHFYKHLYDRMESFSDETFKHKLFFIDEDLVLMQFDASHEAIFHVPSSRIISSFNHLHPQLKYFENFLPQYFWEQEKAGVYDKSLT